MPIDPLAALVDTLRKGQILSPAQLQELSALQEAHRTPRALAEDLVRRGWLTAYQAREVLRGRGPGLRLGQYTLLTPLGEGGMGRVFKARHRLMQRLAAVKLIRKDWLASRNAVLRFQREIQAVARLSHPHVVHAYDADRAGKTYYIAMEYVEGTDLETLVKGRGPLPVAQACAYMRQAALGLQHAHEHGLIHRDIKPANFMVASATGLVKLLDLGLARLQEGAGAEALAYLTRTGAVVGTLDYLSPEQVLASDAVDGRSDLYGLGCTLYRLLTGQVVFPGRTLNDKLVKRCREEAPPVEGLRPEVPPGLAAVVRRVLARQPPDRYQTAAEVAEALAPWAFPPPA
jgi:serine/threonine-protein kinase